MKTATKQLARQVQQALLALPDTLLLTMIEEWVKDLEDESDGTYEILGYQVQSEMTGKLYASLDDFFEAEPEAEEFRWQPPEEHALRATLQKMQPNEIYHVLVTLAGDVFRQKAFAASWAEHPGEHSDGYAFIQGLASYLELRKTGENLSTEQFDVQFEEQLEGLAPPEEEELFDDFPDFFSNAHVFHFRLTFLQPDPQSRQQLLQALQKYDCFLSETTGTSVEGSLPYVHWHKNDLRALSRVQRLLNRWQKAGRIAWTARKEKPPKRPANKKRQRKRS